MSKKYNIVYKTTNIVNGKIYYGVHSTDNLYDGYLGSGKLLQYALDKYGADNFHRTILGVYSNIEQALRLENLIVSKKFADNPYCYNITIGGGAKYFSGKNHPLFGIKRDDIKGGHHPQSKAVMQFSSTGDFISEWPSIKDLGQSLRVNTNNFKSYTSKPLSLFYGHIVRYSDQVEDIEKEEKKIKNLLSKSSHFNSKEVLQFNLDGSFIKVWKSSKNIEREKNFSHSRISLVCNGDATSAYGYVWRYKEDIADIETTSKIIKKEIKNNYCGGWERPVVQLDQQGNAIKTWKNISAAKEQLGINNISAVCRGERNTAGGFKWKYKQEAVHVN